MSSLAMLASGGAWVYTLHARRQAVTERRVRDLDLRLASMEEAIKAVPTAQSWGQLREDLAGIRGDVHTSAAEIRGLGAGLKRVEAHLALLMENELRGHKE
jgi:hypothetical protein